MQTEEEYQHNLRALREALAEQSKRYPLLPGLVYTSLYDFVLQHGREYRPQPWPRENQRGADRQCYGNALILAGRYGLKYVEGVAVSPFGAVIPHGWNSNSAGELIDSTWLNSGLVYLGIEFSAERADDATWNGDAHVLNDEAQGYPVFQKPWQGEDYTIEWPYSDRIESHRLWARTGIYHPAPSVLEWLKEHPMPESEIVTRPSRHSFTGDGSHRRQK